MIQGAIGSVLMILILISFGYLAAFKGWVSEGTSRFITKLVVNITLPCTILNSFLNNFTAAELLSSGKYILTAFTAVLLFLAVGLLFARILKIEKEQRGVFTALFSFSNSVFVGFPVAHAIFGEKGMIFAIFYFFANTTCFNTLAYLLISRDGELMRRKEAAGSAFVEGPGGTAILSMEEAGSLADSFDLTKTAQPPKITVFSMVKRVLQPPVITIFVAIALVLLGIRLPDFANSTIEITSGITSPLSLIFVGTVLHRVGFKTLKFEKGLSWVMVGRFILAPLVMLGVAALFGIDPFASHVFITQMALPVMVTAVIYAESCRADCAFATRCMVMSTLLSLIMLPILVILFGG